MTVEVDQYLFFLAFSIYVLTFYTLKSVRQKALVYSNVCLFSKPFSTLKLQVNSIINMVKSQYVQRVSGNICTILLVRWVLFSSYLI